MIEVVGSEPAGEEWDVPLPRYLSVVLSRWAIPGPAYEAITLQTEGKPVSLEKIPGEFVFYFSPLEPLSLNTTYLLTIPEGAFVNPETEAFSRSFSLFFTTATPPSFVWTSPWEGATEVFRDEPIVVAFSEPIRLDFLWEETLFPEVDGKKVSLTVSTFENLPILRPELPYPAFPPESQVRIRIPPGTVADLKGTSNQSLFVLSFQTSRAGAPPRVVWATPENDAEGVPFDSPIVVIFDRAIEEGPAWELVSLRDESGNLVAIDQVILEANQIELRPLQKLRKGEKCLVFLPPGCVQSKIGTPLAIVSRILCKNTWYISSFPVSCPPDSG